jgi:predicted nucleotidyltransferase
MIQPILKDKIPEVIRLLKEHRVKRAYAFGSVCTDNFNSESDIDLLIAFDDGLDPLIYGESYWTLLEELPKILNRPVDLVTEKSLRNPYFIKVMSKTKTPIYE